jgi:ABC-2 type transport system permease protein
MRPATFAHALRSEWTKLWTLRSTAFTLLTAGVLAVGLSVMFASGATRRYAQDPDEFDPTGTSLQSYILIQLAISVLGVLVVTSEYTTGMIRTSVTAVPRRDRILAAKALVFSAVALVVGQVVAFASFLIGQAVLTGLGTPHVTLSDLSVLRAVIGCGLYLAMVGLLGVAVGVLVRATAGAVMLMVAITLLVPVLTPALPQGIAKIVGKFGPFGAGTRIMDVTADPNLLGPWTGFGVLCLWVSAALAAAVAVFRRRDV